MCIHMLADKVPGSWRSPRPVGSDEGEGRASEALSLPVAEERHRGQRGPGGQPSLLTCAELTYTGLRLVLLGSTLRNTGRSQCQRFKDDYSVPRERLGEQAADRRRPQGCPVVCMAHPVRATALHQSAGRPCNHRPQPAEDVVI